MPRRLHKELRQIHAQTAGHYDAEPNITCLQDLYDAKTDLMYKAEQLNAFREHVEERIHPAAEHSERDPASQEPQPELHHRLEEEARMRDGWSARRDALDWRQK